MSGGCRRKRRVGTAFIGFLRDVNCWCECFSCTGSAGRSCSHRVRDEETGVVPHFCLDFWIAPSIVDQGKELRLESDQECGSVGSELQNILIKVHGCQRLHALARQDTTSDLEPEKKEQALILSTCAFVCRLWSTVLLVTLFSLVFMH